ncbi:O-antigen ligase [Acidaminococcus timonensis]|uniref:O-antigen ligase family protein n=1 Tax=Acidaminococcus timonensis TaxID=1871002 RepID=UPI0025F1F64E|nr:O-antigen ligase family protein [Acidaminococcus timonensis]
MGRFTNQGIYLVWHLSLFLYLFFLTTTISNAGTSITLACSILSTIYVYRKHNIKGSLPDKNFLWPFGLFFLGLLASALVLKDGKSLYGIWKYFTWTIPFWVFYFAGKAHFPRQIHCFATLAANFLLSGYAIYLALFILPYGNRVKGFSSSPNLYAMRIESILPYICLIALLAMQQKKSDVKSIQQGLKKSVLFISVISCFAGVLLTQSRGAYMGVFFGFALVGCIKFLLHRKISATNTAVIVLMLFALLCTVFYAYRSNFKRSYDRERILLWQSSYNMWNDHKVFGVGFSNWQREYREHYISPEAKEPDLPMPHNVVVQFFATTGLIGGIGYLLFVLGETGFLIKRMQRFPHELNYPMMLWAFFLITIHGMVDAGITNKFAMQILCAYMGICLAEEKLPVDTGKRD